MGIAALDYGTNILPLCPQVDVLLATYRPDAAMLKEQIDSILAQRAVTVNLIRREDIDGSGVRENFSAMLTESHGDYVAFSDQDDVWDKDKLVKCFDKMYELEKIYGKNIPLLVFCNGYVTDVKLNCKSGTVLSRQNIEVKKGLKFNRLLMQNFVAGNSMLFNAALREKAGRVPRKALLHDSWIVLVASAFGQIGFVDEPLYLYRQHDKNVIGATTYGVHHFWKRLLDGSASWRMRLVSNIEEASAFVERFGNEAPECAVALSTLLTCGWLQRRLRIFRHRLFKHGLIRNLALIMFA